jgi:hypothetical protein
MYVCTGPAKVPIEGAVLFKLHPMGTNGQLFPLTDNTDGVAVDQVQQQHLFISKLYWVNICLFLGSSYQTILLMYGVHSLCFYSLNSF